MTGFEIKFRGKSFRVSDEFGATIMVTMDNGDFHLDVKGLEEKPDHTWNSHVWIDTPMELGESVEVTIKEIERSDDPAFKRDAFSDSHVLDEKETKEMLTQLLEKYYTLEKLLKKRKLL